MIENMNKKIKSYLSPETLIPLGFVMTIMGGVFWATTMWWTTQVNAKDIATVKIEIKEVGTRNTELERRFERVVTILEQIDRKTEILDSVQFKPLGQ